MCYMLIMAALYLATIFLADFEPGGIPVRDQEHD